MNGTGSRSPASAKVPLKIANSANLHEDEAAPSQNTGEAGGNNTPEKENGLKSSRGARGKPKRKVRGKKNKGGNTSADQSTNIEDRGASPWLATSLGPEAWL